MTRKYVFTHLYDTEAEAQSASTLLMSKFSSSLEKLAVIPAPYGFILQIDTKEIAENAFKEITAELEPSSAPKISQKQEELSEEIGSGVTGKHEQEVPEPKPQPTSVEEAKPEPVPAPPNTKLLSRPARLKRWYAGLSWPRKVALITGCVFVLGLLIAIVAIQFAPANQYNLVTGIDPLESGSLSQHNNTFSPGESVSLTAYPAPGYRFDRWEEDSVARYENPVEVDMNQDRNIVACFVRTYSLAIATNPNGHGSVSPSSGTYDDGTNVTLAASAVQGYRFDHWGGDISSSLNPVSLDMDGDKSVTAYFVLVSPFASTPAAPDIELGTLIFSDNFSDNRKNWAISANAYLQNGEYHLVQTLENKGIMTRFPKAPAADFAFQVLVRKIAGSDNHGYGIFFGSGSSSYYTFCISGDGQYSLLQWTGQVWNNVLNWTPSPFVNQLNNTNTMTVFGKGTKIELHLNGHYLTTVTLPTDCKGGVGVYSGTTGLHATYDNILLYSLAETQPANTPTLTPQQDISSPPCRFHGSVRLNGANVPSGTVIQAFIEGYTYTTTTTSINGDSTYVITIPKASDKTYNGKKVTFKIGNNVAAQTGTWITGGNVQLNLSGTQ